MSDISITFNRYYTDLFINFIALVDKLEINTLTLSFKKDCIYANALVATNCELNAIIEPAGITTESIFENYIVNKESTIQVDPHVLLKLLLNYTKDYCLTLEVHEESKHLVVKPANDSITSEFTIKNIISRDLCLDLSHIPDENHISLGSFFFISKLDVFRPSTSVAINTNNKNTMIMSQDSDINTNIKIKINFNHDNPDFEQKCVNIASDILSLQYSAITYLSYFTRKVNIMINENKLITKYNLSSLGEMWFTTPVLV